MGVTSWGVGRPALACRSVARFVRALVAVVVLVVSGAACRVDVGVGVEAEANGSGRVRVEVTADKEAVAAVNLSAGLRVDDLKQAGWEIDGPTPQPGGGVRIVATKPFTNPDEVRLVLEELGGADGPFREFRLERDRSFARTTTRFSGTVDLEKGIEAFGDAGLRQVLGGSDLGVDLALLAQDANRPVEGLVGVSVAVRLPGEVKANAPETSSAGGRWVVNLGDRSDLTAQSSALNLTNLVGMALVAGGVLALCVVVLNRAGHRRR